MPDMEASEPSKIVERKIYPQVVNILKESIGAMAITKRILDLWVNLTIGELLVSAPAVKKQLTKAIIEDEVVQFEVNTLESSGAGSQNFHFWYSIGSLKAEVRLEDSSNATVLLDT